MTGMCRAVGWPGSRRERAMEKRTTAAVIAVLASSATLCAQLFGPTASASADPHALTLAEHSHAVVPVPAPLPSGYKNSSTFSPAGLPTAPDMEICFPKADGDYAHRSSTGVAASAHGWWYRNGCTAPTAQVEVQLQEYYSNNTWQDKGAAGIKDIPPGKIPVGQRANARVNCSGGTARTGWRSVVTVSTIGQSGYDQKTTADQNIDCRVN